MTESLIIAIVPATISAVITLVGVLTSNNKKQAVTDEKIENLTREVRKHNNFAEKIPVIEESIENIKEKVNYFHKI
jgi:septation ring formation regulator EzrA